MTQGRRPTSDPDVVDNPEDHRYEIRSGSRLAGFAFYSLTRDGVAFTHTEVHAAFAGRGLGSRLAQAALNDVRSRGLRAVPICPFIAGWIRRHPEYLDLVDEADQAAVEARE